MARKIIALFHAMIRRTTTARMIFCELQRNHFSEKAGENNRLENFVIKKFAPITQTGADRSLFTSICFHTV